MRAEGLEHLILYRRDPRRALTEKEPKSYGWWPGVKLWHEDFLKDTPMNDPSFPYRKIHEDELAIMLFSSGCVVLAW